MYNNETRDRVRDKQDRILALAERLHLDDYLQLSDAFPGSPRIRQLHSIIFPEWEAAIDAALRSLEMRTTPAPSAPLAAPIVYPCDNCGQDVADKPWYCVYCSVVVCSACLGDHEPHLPPDPQTPAAREAALPIATVCPECGTRGQVLPDPYGAIRPEFQCAACPTCTRIYRVQAHLAPEPELPAYNPEDGAPCAQCGHGQELHYEGVAECWESSDTTPPVGCPCPQFQAREAAQRADEADLATILYDWLCFDCGHRFEAAREDYACPRCQSPHACMANSSAHTARADEAELQAGLLATLPPMAGGRGPVPRRERPNEPYIVAELIPWKGPRYHAGVTTRRAGVVTCLSLRNEHYRTARVWHVFTRRQFIKANGEWGDEENTPPPPMAGGAPSHYDDPAWYADEAWALQAERNAESAREAADDEPAPETVSFPYGAQRHLAGRRLLCRAGHRLDSHTPPGTLIEPPHADAAITICRCSRLVDGSCMNLWPGHPAYGTCRCACHAPPMAGGAPTCFYCEHHGDGVVPATRQITFIDNDAPRSEWVCDECARTYGPEPPPPPSGAIWPHFAGKREQCPQPNEYACPRCREDRSATGATDIYALQRYSEPPSGQVWCRHLIQHDPSPPTAHTHPCPTCHQARPCTGTGCADGPRECSTCSQCRGW